MPVYSYDGTKPRIGRGAYIHPDAILIGDVRIGELASVWPGAVLRGDHGYIEIGARTSIQDGTVVHTTQDYPTVVGPDCVVGHNAHLEGCQIGERCLIGSMSTVLNRVRIGPGSVVGAGAVVPEGLAAPDGSMLLGVPARIREGGAGAGHGARIEYSVQAYLDNARQYPLRQRPVALEDCLADADLP